MFWNVSPNWALQPIGESKGCFRLWLNSLLELVKQTMVRNSRIVLPPCSVMSMSTRGQAPTRTGRRLLDFQEIPAYGTGDPFTSR